MTSRARPALLPGILPCGGCRRPRHATVGRVPCPRCGTVRWTLAVTISPSLAQRPDRVLPAARAGLLDLRNRMGGWPAFTLHGDSSVDRFLAARLTAAGWTVEAVAADWNRHGRRAGILRDLVLLARADALLAVWNGASTATRHTLDLAARRHLTVACHIVPDSAAPRPEFADTTTGASR